MKLQRLRVSELRQFRTPFELAGIAPGLNIFTGANEAGKSTLVRAIRAAVFERHRSTSVDDLRPYGDAAASPRVELDFEIAGTAYRLSKTFLQKKRCELFAGTRRLEGAEAEDLLAELLGFRFAERGANRDEYLGIPGLLWIDQGKAQQLRDAVRHAADHLRSALDESLGAVAASDGDEVVAQLRKRRDELLTSTGRPKAAYLKTIDEAAEFGRQVADLQQALETYRGQVDQLRLLRDAHAADARDAPWDALRRQQTEAQKALDAVQALGGQRDRARETLRQVVGLRTLLAQRLAAAAQQRQDLAAREAARLDAAAQHERAVALEAQCAQAEAAAAARLQAAREALALARQEDNRAALGRQLADAQIRSAELAELLDRAIAENERAATLEREAAHLHIEAADLAALRRQQARLNELEIAQAAVATRLRFDLLDGAPVRLAGEPLGGQGERRLVAPATLLIDGVGQIHIAPGGSDLAELAQQHAALRDEHEALLQRLGLATLAEAETRERAHAQRLADADAADKARKLLAPKGLDVLRKDLDAARARQDEAAAALARLPAGPAGSLVLPSLDAAERHHEACRDAAEAAGRQLQAARQSLASAGSQRDATTRERDALQAALADPHLQAELAAKSLELVAADSRVSALEAAIAEIETRIAAARPEILGQDVERLRRSADEAERQHHARDRQIVQVETALAAAGAQGLDEELARCRSEETLAQRRLQELRRRAEALDYLLQRLESRRQALTRRLQAPLQKHLDRYLQLLFPSGRLDVDEDLVPGALTRSGPRGPDTGDFETLSFGAREQMGVIGRLAYADLLKDAGRPTLIILDDALVHSDDERLGRMKRVLFDAAQRHQVLLFTCHPEKWRDMGVALRPLAGA